ERVTLTTDPARPGRGAGGHRRLVRLAHPRAVLLRAVPPLRPARVLSGQLRPRRLAADAGPRAARLPTRASAAPRGHSERPLNPSARRGHWSLRRPGDLGLTNYGRVSVSALRLTRRPLARLRPRPSRADRARARAESSATAIGTPGPPSRCHALR